ncbi:S8 family peptidase, partial [Caballeronia sp. BR00000012568055]|uniref:S8 family peptidase n=1 Tax=Caballeronia sp. BR00000012568055 TaxID=2918761 RepID=UPI0023F652B3
NLLQGSSDGEASAAVNNSRVASARGISIQERSVTGTQGHVIETSKGLNASEAQAFMLEYLKSADVEYIEPDLIIHPALVPNDARYNEQWGMSNGATGIGLPNAWDKSTGKNVVVAVIDTGITAHSDLSEQVLPGYNFISDARFDRNRNGRSNDASDPGDWLQAGDQCPAAGGTYYVHDSTWHGTHVAGIIAAKSNNGTGVAGTAFNAKILPVRALGRCGGFTSDINDAIIWASGGSVPGVPNNPNPAKVINLSLSGAGQCSKTAQDAIDIARNNGAVVVQAAGNDAIDASQKYATPECQGEIVVGATNSSGERTSFSNFGSLVNLMAPGAYILSTWNAGPKGPEGESYGYMDGTSQATPHVAGVVALLLEKDPTLTLDQIRRYLMSTVTPMTGRCLEGCGAGLVNADKALASLPIAVDGDLPQTPDEVTVSVNAEKGATYRLEIPEATELLKMVVAEASSVSIRSEFDQEWTSCKPALWPAWTNCFVWNPKPGFYYVKMSTRNGINTRVATSIYIGAGHLDFGETIKVISKPPYFPRVITLDKISSADAVRHTFSIDDRVYGTLSQYSSPTGQLFELNENADPSQGGDGIYNSAWMLVGPNGTGVGQNISTQNSPNLKIVLSVSNSGNLDAHYSYTAAVVPK